MTWLGQASPEQCVPVLWDNPSPTAANMYQLLIIQAFRPDRVIAAAQQLVAAVLGPAFMPRAERELDLVSIVDRDISAATPAILCSVTGYDASGNISLGLKNFHKYHEVNKIVMMNFNNL